MDLEIKNDNGTLTIKIIGKIDTMTAPKLEEEISKNSNGVNEVVFNFEQVKISFEDNGIKFNPLEKEDPDTNSKIEDMQIGGLGIYIVKESMDNIEYKYENNKNILILSKNI